MFKAGGRVVKNVTGFDISKLMAGSYGTLAAMTGITMKVLPAAETEETLVLSGLDDARAITVMSLALQSSCEVSGAAHIPGNPALTFLRLEGVRPSVFYRRDKLALLLKDFAACDVLALDKSRVQWLAIRDVHPLADEQQRHVWRLSVAPSLGFATVAKISAGIDARYYYDWAGGLIWLSLPASADASVDIVRGSFQEGHATLMRAPEDVRARVEVFQPQGEALAALTARVKNSFDPAGAFNFGRMYRNH